MLGISMPPILDKMNFVPIPGFTLLIGPLHTLKISRLYHTEKWYKNWPKFEILMLSSILICDTICHAFKLLLNQLWYQHQTLHVSSKRACAYLCQILLFYAIGKWRKLWRIFSVWVKRAKNSISGPQRLQCWRYLHEIFCVDSWKAYTLAHKVSKPFIH